MIEIVLVSIGCVHRHEVFVESDDLDETALGEYRTKRVVLAMYDEMAAAMASKGEYQTWLEPGAADPAVAHRRRDEDGSDRGLR